MLMQSTKVNELRFSQNKPTISSVWFWGMGKLPQNLKSSYDLIYTEDSLVHGLSLSANIPCNRLQMCDLPFQSSIKNKNSLVADFRFYHLFKHQNNEAGAALLQFYENNWFTPLLHLLANGELDKLRINCADGREFVIRPFNLKYFWRKTHPLAQFIVKK
jgi:hypothetical protein